jgi:hypothetical protein
VTNQPVDLNFFRLAFQYTFSLFFPFAQREMEKNPLLVFPTLYPA